MTQKNCWQNIAEVNTRNFIMAKALGITYCQGEFCRLTYSKPNIE